MNLLETFIKIGVKDETTDATQGILDGVANMAGKVAGALAAYKIGETLVEFGQLAVDGYAQYEQLIGGVKKLYDTEMGTASDILIANAENAYKTVGMSANSYMSSVTAFSAALVNSLGGDTVAAAEAADMAMRDISDNANTFGKYSAEELTQVYQALAKGQYQTLDNLNLGFGGTKEGMQQLIDKANELKEANGEVGELSIDSFADMVEAIHVVQDEMQIMGTTEKEAATTVEGSFNMMKAAAQNFVAGLGSENANVAELAKQLVETAKQYLSQVIPVIGQIVTSCGETIMEILPDVIADVATYLISHIPDVLAAAVNLFAAIITGLVKTIDRLAETAAEVVRTGVIEPIAEFFGDMVDAGANLIDGMVQGVFSGVSSVVNAIRRVCSNALDAVKSFFGIASPSKVMRNMFQFVGEGAVLGIEDEADAISRAWDDATSGIGDVTASIGVRSGLSGSNGYGAAYYFGDITLSVENLKDVLTIEEFADVLMQYKRVNAY